MMIRISYGTYKMFWEAGSEDVVRGRRSEAEEAILGERAKARHEERLRCRFL
jgi:paired amphipathic helix protein Sin3a